MKNKCNYPADLKYFLPYYLGNGACLPGMALKQILRLLRGWELMLIPVFYKCWASYEAETTSD